MNAEVIRVGIVGAGTNTREVHIPRLREIPGVEIVAVANRTRATAEAAARTFGIARVCDRWQEVTADPGIDAVLVGTWPNLHRDVTVAALEAGKHVLCEARMAMNAAEAREMLAASLAHPRCIAQLVPAPYTLELDAAVKRLLSEGWLGRLLAVDVRTTAAAFVDETSPLHWRQDAAKSGLNALTLGIWYECAARWIGHARSRGRRRTHLRGTAHRCGFGPRGGGDGTRPPRRARGDRERGEPASAGERRHRPGAVAPRGLAVRIRGNAAGGRRHPAPLRGTARAGGAARDRRPPGANESAGGSSASSSARSAAGSRCA